MLVNLLVVVFKMTVGILDENRGADRTVRIFDSFYDWDININPNQFDIVNSYFRSTISNRRVADNFTAFVFRISHETGVDALELIDYLKGRDKLEMNSTIAYYLNSFKNMASLYGVARKPLSNQFVARNIAV